jgi:hypothetical protein
VYTDNAACLMRGTSPWESTMPIRTCWLAAVIGCSLLGLPWPIAAQTSDPKLDPKVGISVMTGGTKADSASGVAFSLGGVMRVGPVFAEVNPLDATMFGKDTGAFQTETEYYLGEEREYCLNTQNGQEVGSSNCSGDIGGRNAPTVNFGVVIPRTPVFFGAGHRFDKGFNTWFGSGGIMWQTEGRAVLTLRTNVGPDYFSFTVGTSILF